MAKHDSIPVSSSKLPLFAPFAVPKIGNMATAWHEILHLGTKQRHSAGSIVNLAPAATRCEASGQYQCMTDAVIWQIPGKVLHDPVFAARYPNLMLSVIELLGTLVLTYHTYLTDMLMDDFVTRFSRFLISLSLERGSDEFPLGMTQEQLASVFGVHRATLARAIQHLKQEAIIACFTCRRVEIIDMERLRHMAHL